MKYTYTQNSKLLRSADLLFGRAGTLGVPLSVTKLIKGQAIAHVPVRRERRKELLAQTGETEPARIHFLPGAVNPFTRAETSETCPSSFQKQEVYK
jgi:hypothetical protein